MSQKLAAEIAKITELPANQVESMLSAPKDPKLGDLAFPCFVLAKSWSKNPAECAEKLAADLRLPADIDSAQAAGPYLNFFIDRAQHTSSIIEKILKEQLDYGKHPENQKETILVEYSSPNIAKPFHIGHLRTTIIGLSLHKIYKHLGYNTIAINHLGDWGTQFGFVYAGHQIWNDKKTDNLDSLVSLYIDANGLRKAQENNSTTAEEKDLPEVNQMARDYFIRLEQGDEEAKAFWQKCLDISMEYLLATYKKLGIEFDHFTGESFYIPLLDDAKALLEQKKVLVESEGAYGVDLRESHGKKLGFVRFLTPDGRTLYMTRDLAAADYRQKTFQPEKALYVVGAPQSLHFQQLRAVLKTIDHPMADKIVHIPFGHVPGIGTRSLQDNKDSFSLMGLIEEAEERALDTYQNAVTKRPENVDEEIVSKAVALAAIYFNYLCRTNIKDFHFTWEEALNFQGDTGPYLLYALARLNGIIAKANKNNIKLAASLDPKLLASEEVYEIIVLLNSFPKILEKITNDYEPNHLAQFALSLAKQLSKNYKSLRVVGEEDSATAEARLALFTACKFVLEISISLLGIPTLERM